MHKAEKIDFAKLLGFSTVSHEISNGVDFQDEIIGTKLGAKVGVEQPGSLDYARLLGLQTISDRLSDVDFQDESIGGKLGAKVGFEGLVACDALAAPADLARKAD